MKKSRLFVVAMLFAIFASAFIFAPSTSLRVVNNAAAPASPIELDFSPEALGDPFGTAGIWAQEADMSLFVADGNISEWVAAGIVEETFGSADVYLAYNDTVSKVYVAVVWADATYDIAMAQWNKTGLYNQTEYPGDAMWDLLDGADDVVQIGFSDGTETDMWIWTASNRTADGFAFECDELGVADGGTLPYDMNTNGTDFTGNVKPIYDNDGTAIPDYTVIPNGTLYNAWLDEPTAPSGSQTDVVVGWTWNDAGNGLYIAEFVRDFDTGNADDFILDFADDLSFCVGVANGDATMDMLIPVECHAIGLTNLPCALSMDAIPALVTETLVITGEAYDDYTGAQIIIEDSTWEGATQTAGLMPETGTWNILLNFNEDDLPLGDHELTATLVGKYGCSVSVNATFEVDDVNAPVIEGLLDVAAGWANRTAPLSVETIVVIAGLSDDYTPVDEITANLYYYKDEDVALAVPMSQFATGGSTFNGNFTIVHSDVGINHNYTYWVQAWDGNLNKATSAKITFTSVPAVIPTTITPGFGILAGLFGTAVAVFIIKKKKN